MLSRMLRRDLLGAKVLLLTIIAILALGVMCFVTLQSAYRNLNGAKQRYAAECRLADFWIAVRRAPLAEVHRLAATPGLAALEGRLTQLATADLPGLPEPANVQIVSLPDRRPPAANLVVLRSGRRLSPDGGAEVVLSEKFAEAHQLREGDSLPLLLNNRYETLRVVGSAISSEFAYLISPGAMMPDPRRFGVCYVSQSFAENAFGAAGAVNEITGRFAPGTTDAQRRAALRRLERALEPYGLEATTLLPDQLSNQFLSAELEGLGAFAALVPSVFLIVAALVLNVLLSRLVRQQRIVIGTLKALGHTDARLCLHYLSFGLVVGLIGAAVGCGLGQWAAAGMTSMYQQYFEFPDLRADYHPGLLATALALSLACAVLGSLRGVGAVLALQPAAAMRSEPPPAGRRVLAERWKWLWSRLGAAWRLAIRSLSRQRIRTASTLFSASMGAGLLVAGFMLWESQQHLVEYEFFRVQRSDIDVTLAGERTREAVEEIRRLPGVVWAEPRFDLPCTLVHGARRKKMSVTGLQAGARLTVPRNAGRPVRLPEHGLVLGRRLAEQLDVAPGDWLTLIPTRGRREPTQLPVREITDGYFGMTAYADLICLSRVTGHDWLANSVQLQTDRAPGAVEQLYSRLKKTPAVRSVNARRDVVQAMLDMMLEAQLAFILVLVGFAGAIFFGSILNASMVNLSERRSEVATLLALGYGPWQVGAMFLRESLMINLAGVLLGIPIGRGLLIATAALYESDLIRLPVVSRPWIPAVTLLVGFGFALAAQAVVQRTIHRMNWLEALKVKE